MGDRKDDCIQVVVRCRPFNTKEKNEGRGNIIEIDGEARKIQINNVANPQDGKRYVLLAPFRIFWRDSYPTRLKN